MLLSQQESPCISKSSFQMWRYWVTAENIFLSTDSHSLKSCGSTMNCNVSRVSFHKPWRGFTHIRHCIMTVTNTLREKCIWSQQLNRVCYHLQEISQQRSNLLFYIYLQMLLQMHQSRTINGVKNFILAQIKFENYSLTQSPKWHLQMSFQPTIQNVFSLQLFKNRKTANPFISKAVTGKCLEFLKE